eukprot:m.131542 g.131542  ORF g.131542 m.131542 type:complete len:607 (-) comp11316_c0_seq1:364-2184(-)
MTRSPKDAAKTLVVWPSAGEKGAIVITQGDVDRLEEGEFLNDVIINFYLAYVHRQLPPEAQKKVHVFPTLFYRRLSSERSDPHRLKGFKKVRKWTKNVDIFDKEYLLVPICENAHWFLAVICNPGMRKQDAIVITEPAESDTAAPGTSFDDVRDKSEDVAMSLPNNLPTSRLTTRATRSSLVSTEYDSDHSGYGSATASAASASAKQANEDALLGPYDPMMMSAATGVEDNDIVQGAAADSTAVSGATEKSFDLSLDLDKPPRHDRDMDSSAFGAASASEHDSQSTDLPYLDTPPTTRRTRSGSTRPSGPSAKRPKVVRPPTEQLCEKRPCILTLDSLGTRRGTRNNPVCKMLRLYLGHAWKHQQEKREQEGLPKRDERTFEPTDLDYFTVEAPQQPNLCDCGVYVCKYAMRILGYHSHDVTNFDPSGFGFHNYVPQAFRYNYKEWFPKEEVTQLRSDIKKQIYTIRDYAEHVKYKKKVATSLTKVANGHDADDRTKDMDTDDDAGGGPATSSDPPTLLPPSSASDPPPSTATSTTEAAASKQGHAHCIDDDVHSGSDMEIDDPAPPASLDPPKDAQGTHPTGNDAVENSDDEVESIGDKQSSPAL